MHELPLTESILNIVLKYAAGNEANQVLSIHMQIGELSDVEEEWLQRYFDYLSKGTVAEGAKLKIERMPVVVQCVACQMLYEVQPAQMGSLVCPACGGKSGTLVSGREYHVKAMEVL
ncbi:MAG: hydrogenase maturation nickel metallochaperone HypA [Dethiobacter sp.]|nr:hydrogenase maturation nickel metallochaperone HypA [Dethiobacter sp.]